MQIRFDGVGLRISSAVQPALSDNVQAKASEPLELHVRTRQPDELAMVFTQMLCRIGSVYSTLQTMADLGILAWILPESLAE